MVILIISYYSKIAVSGMQLLDTDCTISWNCAIISDLMFFSLLMWQNQAPRLTFSSLCKLFVNRYVVKVRKFL